MGLIKIQNLELFARHGVLNEENTLGQKFIISATLTTSFDRAAATDDILKAVNYAAVCDFLYSFNHQNTFKLIETAADAMAKGLLAEFELIDSVEIEIKKPNPPIHLHFDCVSATVVRKRHRAYISLGSNMGDKEKYIENAINAINENGYCSVKKVSSLIETKPYGNVEQDNFLNGCAEIETILSPQELLLLLQEIENKNGRVRTIHWGPRTLDLDILLYDNLVTCEDNLVIPHPDMQNRNFVLEPLLEIAPYVVHPVERKNVSELCKLLKNQ